MALSIQQHRLSKSLIPAMFKFVGGNLCRLHPMRIQPLRVVDLAKLGDKVNWSNRSQLQLSLQPMNRREVILHYRLHFAIRKPSPQSRQYVAERQTVPRSVLCQTSWYSKCMLKIFEKQTFMNIKEAEFLNTDNKRMLGW